MILPIYLYGSPALRQATTEIAGPSEALERLIEDLFETMHSASGIGLAAPQVGRPERLFVVDLRPLASEFEEEFGEVPEYATTPMVFINPQIVGESDAEVAFEEGCLSIPEIRERVERSESIRMRYLDQSFQPQEVDAEGMFARVLQHEYDHLEGVLFIDRLSALRRRMLQRRLRAIAAGEVDADYPVTAE